MQFIYLLIRMHIFVLCKSKKRVIRLLEKVSVEKVIKSLQNVWREMNESQPLDCFA